MHHKQPHGFVKPQDLNSVLCESEILHLIQFWIISTVNDLVNICISRISILLSIVLFLLEDVTEQSRFVIDGLAYCFTSPHISYMI